MKYEVLRLLPEDTRIGLKNQESLKKLLTDNPSEIKKVLDIDKQRFYRYKTGKTRLSKEQLDILSKEFAFQWKGNIKDYGLEGSCHTIELPERIAISEDISWLLGFHSTESSETPHSFGVCNSEFVLIERLQRSLSELGINKDMMQLEVRYIRGKDAVISENRLETMNARFRRLSKDSLTKKPLYTLRVCSRLIKEYLRNLETRFTLNFLQFDKKIQAAFLQGIFDADGWFNKAKKIIVITQKDGKYVDMICKNLDILNIINRREYWKYRDYHACVIVYGKNGSNLKRFFDIIGFSHPEKATRVKCFLLPA
jgi:hypothetical protein